MNLLSKKSSSSVCLIGVALGAIACGGGSGGSSAQPPSGFSYPASIALYILGVPVQASSPNFSGAVDSFSVDPALPAGLSLDAMTGVISGAPLSAQAAQTFTITATGPAGSAMTDVEIGVEQPPRFAYVPNLADDTISIFATDAATGILAPAGFEPLGSGEIEPRQLRLHPNGNFAYVPNSGDGMGVGPTLSIYSIDTDTGRLTAQAPEALANGPHSIELNADGSLLYIASRGDDQVSVFAVDAGTGAVTPMGTPALTGSDPGALVLDPEGRFLYVANEGVSTLSAFNIDGATGALSSAGVDIATNGTPVGLAPAPDGSTLYVVTSMDEIVPFAIDQTTGLLTPGNALATGIGTTGVAAHPTGRFVYSVNGGDDDLSAFEVDSSTGALTFIGRVDAGDLPGSISFDASGLYAYVVNTGSVDLTIYNVDLATGLPSASGTRRTRAGATQIALSTGVIPVNPAPEFLYVLNNGSEDISSFSVDSTTGVLTSLGVNVPAGGAPRDLAVDPRGRFLFASSGADSTVSIFSIGATGELSSSLAPVALPGEPRGLFVEPSGRHLYAATTALDRLVAFAIDGATGGLTQTDSVTILPSAFTVAIDPTGQFAYVTHVDTSMMDDPRVICSYRVASGLILTTAEFAPAPGNPRSITFSPSGERAYAALRDANILAPYIVNAETGMLTAIPPGQPSGQKPNGIVAHPNGRFVYAAVSELFVGSGFAGLYPVQPGTGDLLAEQSFPGGLNPSDVAVDPSGQFLYVTNQLGDDISMFAINGSTGALTSMDTAQTGVAPVRIQITGTF